MWAFYNTHSDFHKEKTVNAYKISLNVTKESSIIHQLNVLVLKLIRIQIGNIVTYVYTTNVLLYKTR